MRQILLWGCGRDYNLLMGVAQWKKDVKIVGIIESKKRDGYLITNGGRLPIYEPAEIKHLYYDAIIISNSYWKEIEIIVNENNISKENIIVPYIKENGEKYDIVKQVGNYIENAESAVDILSHGSGIIVSMSYDNTEKTLFNDKETWKREGFAGDYVWVRTLELLISEMKEKNTEGAMAEVGVFQGRFAKIMRYYFPEKKLYLFDTFKGFDEKDYVNEVSKGNFTEEWMQAFNDTSLDKVKELMGNNERNYYRVGYFPNTLEPNDKEQMYCLVSLDTDMYNPTLAGLRFFYPRLVKGGYIMVHDYNIRYMYQTKDIINLSGVKQAVKDYQKECDSMCIVPIPDKSGTVIITK